jgi:phosphoribosylaminoimidazolecarboxamide formyltransferase/IMP cyclohydrolase
MMGKIQRALISVHDKTGLLPLAKALLRAGVEIIATGGTARFLRESGLAATSLEKLIDFPEMLDGRVKTLHPKIFGALLARRDVPAHVEQSRQHGIGLIDLVVVNLYPFAEAARRPEISFAEVIENIDIGGVALIRAAAKNYHDIAVVTSVHQYEEVLVDLKVNDGALSDAMRQRLAIAAFRHTTKYDATIYEYLLRLENAEKLMPDVLLLDLEKVQNLRYGENPHQPAAFYRDQLSPTLGLTGAAVLQGKELSYNNIADLDAVFCMLQSFDNPCTVIVKHGNPCGVAIGETLYESYQRAKETDPASAFGGVVGFNRPVDEQTAKAVSDLFTECILAPHFEAPAREIFFGKKNLRLLASQEINQPLRLGYDFKRVYGGVLVQRQDLAPDDRSAFKAVTKRQPTEREWAAMLFGWNVVRYVKSNAIVYTTADRTIGIGAGQMSRVDASLLAVEKAHRAGLSVAGTAVASDAFFPFPDGVVAAAKAGATAVIQPGGSVRDEQVIAEANEHHLTMVFTGVRHFRH